MNLKFGHISTDPKNFYTDHNNLANAFDNQKVVPIMFLKWFGYLYLVFRRDMPDGPDMYMKLVFI